MNRSARVYCRLLNLARSIADLTGSHPRWRLGGGAAVQAACAELAQNNLTVS